MDGKGSGRGQQPYDVEHPTIMSKGYNDAYYGKDKSEDYTGKELEEYREGQAVFHYWFIKRGT